MNPAILTGNGFDIAHYFPNTPTNFLDFIEYLRNNEEKYNKNESLDEFEKLVGISDISEWNQFEDKLSKIRMTGKIKVEDLFTFTSEFGQFFIDYLRTISYPEITFLRIYEIVSKSELNLTTNYTHLLEETYKARNVIHLHGDNIFDVVLGDDENEADDFVKPYQTNFYRGSSEEASPIVMSYSIDKKLQRILPFFVSKNHKYANSRLYDGMTYQLRTDLLATYAKLLKGEIDGIPVDIEIYDFVSKYLLSFSDYDVNLQQLVKEKNIDTLYIFGHSLKSDKKLLMVMFSDIINLKVIICEYNVMKEIDKQKYVKNCQEVFGVVPSFEKLYE